MKQMTCFDKMKHLFWLNKSFVLTGKSKLCLLQPHYYAWAEHAKTLPTDNLALCNCPQSVHLSGGMMFRASSRASKALRDKTKPLRADFRPSVCGFIHEWLLELNSGSSSQLHTTTDCDRVWCGVEGHQNKHRDSIMNGKEVEEKAEKAHFWPWHNLGEIPLDQITFSPSPQFLCV